MGLAVRWSELKLVRTLRIATLIVALVMLAGCQSEQSETAAVGESTKSSVAPESLGLLPVNSEQLLAQVAESDAQAVLVNIWATWCVPCRDEFPDIMRVHEELKDSGFELILVSGDFNPENPEIREFLSEQGVDFTTYIKDEDDMVFINTLEEDWGGALPATFLYDENGTLIKFWEGKTDYETLRESVDAVLSQGAKPEKKETE